MYIAKDTKIKSTVQKINLVADLIRKKNVNLAVYQLLFCKKKTSKILLKILNSALSNSQNFNNIILNNLFVYEVKVGKSITLKRSRITGKGRINSIKKHFVKVTIIIKEGNCLWDKK